MSKIRTAYISKVYDVRLVAVGSALFAADIHAGSDAARVDFRADYGSLSYSVATIPEQVATGLPISSAIADLLQKGQS